MEAFVIHNNGKTYYDKEKTDESRITDIEVPNEIKLSSHKVLTGGELVSKFSADLF